MKKILLTMVLGITAVSLTPQSSQAALLFYDGFDYANNTTLAYLPPNNVNNVGGWSIAPGENSGVATSPGLTYSGLSTVGNSVNDTSITVANVHNVPGVSTSDGSEVWLSFLATSNNTENARVGLFTSGPLSNDGVAAYVWSTGRVAVGNMNTGNMAYSANNTATWSNTNLVVMKVTFAAGVDSISLWVNPTIGGAPGTAAVTHSFDITTASTNLTFRTGGTWQGTFDEFRVGTSFADVTPVPEPTTWALLAGGLTTVMILRRRRRA